MKSIILFAVCAMVLGISASPVPVVIWHGMGDNCCSSPMQHLIKLMTAANPGIYVKSVMVGTNPEQDALNGFFMTANDQIKLVCNQLESDPNLRNGFHAVGLSQGGQFLRAVVQRCNVTVFNLVTLGAQHQGVFGFPRCPANNSKLCEYVRELLDYGAYFSAVQSRICQSNYWHDPLDETTYLRACKFLPDINNAHQQKNQEYKDRLSALHNFVMVMFENDQMVQPRESSWFGFYRAGQDKEVVPLSATQLYQDDWLGLKQLDSLSRLHFISTPGDHLQFTDQWFLTSIVKPFLT